MKRIYQFLILTGLPTFVCGPPVHAQQMVPPGTTPALNFQLPACAQQHATCYQLWGTSPGQIGLTPITIVPMDLGDCEAEAKDRTAEVRAATDPSAVFGCHALS